MSSQNGESECRQLIMTLYVSNEVSFCTLARQQTQYTVPNIEILGHP